MDSGIPDFRSAGGLWSKFDPAEYATVDAFFQDPQKAWRFYRELGHTLLDKKPSPAHVGLAQLERRGMLRGVITQNVDGLHTAAGSRHVVEVHGEHTHLHCLHCDCRLEFTEIHLEDGPIPHCPECGFPLKPNVVLFGEPVRKMEEVVDLTAGCDLLLVIGTSAEVYPVAELPRQVRGQGGQLLEFNTLQTALTPYCEFAFRGRAARTVPYFVRAVLEG